MYLKCLGRSILRSAQDFMKVGDEVEAVILTLDREERKMSLGIKQLKADPWQNIDSITGKRAKHRWRLSENKRYALFTTTSRKMYGCLLYTSRCV